MTLLKDMLNPDSLEEARKGKIEYLSIDTLEPNPLNTAISADIELLEKNIAEGGLLQPLIVINKNGRNIIHSGHRRFKAIQRLKDKNVGFNYMGKHLIDEIPCIYIKDTFKDNTEEKISIMRSNCYRNNLTVKDKKELILQASECYEQLKENNKAPNGRKREWIASLTGISERVIQDVLSNEKKCGKLPQLETEEMDDEEILNLEVKKITKLMNKLSSKLANTEIDKNKLDDDIKQSFNKNVLKLMDCLLKI